MKHGGDVEAIHGVVTVHIRCHPLLSQTEGGVQGHVLAHLGDVQQIDPFLNVKPFGIGPNPRDLVRVDAHFEVTLGTGHGVFTVSWLSDMHIHVTNEMIFQPKITHFAAKVAQVGNLNVAIG